MSKRIVIGGLLAIGLSLAMSESAQAQSRGGRHFHGGGYGRPVYNVPVYRPVLVAPLYSGIHSPYFGFGSTNGYFPAPIYGTPVFGYNRGFGYHTPGVLNIGYSRPGFGINFGTILR